MLNSLWKHRAMLVGNDHQHGGDMREPRVDDRVRLTQDLPELQLTRGTVGVVRSTWFAPTVAYEVEFQPTGLDFQTRALLLATQVEVEEDGLLFDEQPAAVAAATSPHPAL
jgi:hypothetical protein